MIESKSLPKVKSKRTPEHSSNKTPDQIITHRENITISFRTTKKEKDIMNKRFKDIDFTEEIKYLQIKQEHLNIPEEIFNEFDLYDEKYNLLAEWFSRDDDYFKLAIFKLKQMSTTFEDYNNEGIDLPY